MMSVWKRWQLTPACMCSCQSKLETFRGVQDLSRTSHIQKDQLSKPCVHDLLAEASQTLYSVSTEDQTTSMTSTVHPGSGQCQVKACKPSTCLFGIWHEWC